MRLLIVSCSCSSCTDRQRAAPYGMRLSLHAQHMIPSDRNNSSSSSRSRTVALGNRFRALCAILLAFFLEMLHLSEIGGCSTQSCQGVQAVSPVAFECAPHEGLHCVQALRLPAYEGHQKIQRP